MKKTFTLFLSLMPFLASAYDFEVDDIYYNITSETECEVTYQEEGVATESYNEGIVIPDSVVVNDSVVYRVTSIGEEAFYSCAIPLVSIPSTVTKIGKYAFVDCEALAEIVMRGEVPAQIEASTFSKSTANQCTLSVPKGSKEAYQEAKYWQNFVNIVEYVIEVKATGIKLDAATLTAIEGDTLTLTATVTPDDVTNAAVTWATSDTAVAVVNEGVIIALTPGTAIITATTTDGTELSDSCVVTVEKKVILASGIELSAKELQLEPGQTAELTATVTPADATTTAVEWTSSDEAVVVVNNGLVEAKGAGKATITVTTTDGTNLKATCEVEVIAPVILVQYIVLDEIEVEMTVGESMQLRATVLPYEADNQVLDWSSTDIHVAMCVDGLVAAIGEGSCTITAAATDGSGVSTTCKFNVVPVTSISEINSDAAGAEIYNLNGTRSRALQQGIQLIKKADGSVEKVIVK